MMAEAVSAVAKDSSDSESENEAEMEPVEGINRKPVFKAQIKIQYIIISHCAISCL